MNQDKTKSTGRDATPNTLHQPTDINRQLPRVEARQHHRVIHGMQKK